MTPHRSPKGFLLYGGYNYCSLKKIGIYNSGFSKLRMELFLRIDFHMKLLLGGTETFHGGNILVVLGSTISIFAVCTYAYVFV